MRGSASKMGLIVSSAVAAGPAVLADLETPYAVLQERKRKERERQVMKSKTRRPKSKFKNERRKGNIWVV